MLPLSLKIAWVVLGALGTMMSWIVMCALGQNVGTFWIPVMYCTFLTVLEASVCMGMIWNMDPMAMPKAFCLGQISLVNFSILALTGVSACFNWTITSSVLWPGRTDLSAGSTLKWRNYYIFPTVVFPIAFTSIQATLIHHYNAYSPADDLWCDINDPIWIRFFGYAGMPWLLSLPCFIMSIVASTKIVYLHIQHRRLANRLYKSHLETPQASPDMPVFATTADEIRGQVEGPIPSPPIPAQQDFKLPELVFPTHLEAGNNARPSTAKSAQSSASSFHRRRAFSMSPVSEVFTPAIFRDTEEELFESDTVSIASSEGSDTGSWMSHTRGRPPAVVGAGCTEPSGSRWQASDQPASAAAPEFTNAFRGIWRLFLFQGTFFALDFMASISTVIAFATGRPVPPFASHHIALFLLPWAPVVVFGHSPGVRRGLKVIYLRLYLRCRVLLEYVGV
ncbi:hypothetical protein FIBSPDRAFT_200226 [Athelia psychrophila]|uniref:G-protein coupled receptors family 2 profile 2 domain-containing protein n=1 Tax=Athelia psychrophila TaxID=1759441 RepID=A0A165ZJD9_9AGAM|nr:hypothetical protein FIBSPDRAFT_200226 [Fibularhizoctonia sp. CBS 109695]